MSLKPSDRTVTTGGGPSLGLDLLRGTAALVVFLCHLRSFSFVEFGALPIDGRD